MKQNSRYTHGVVVQNTLVILPIETLVLICSFLPVRDIVKVRCVLKILHQVGEITLENLHLVTVSSS